MKRIFALLLLVGLQGSLWASDSTDREAADVPPPAPVVSIPAGLNPAWVTVHQSTANGIQYVDVTGHFVVVTGTVPDPCQG